MKEQKIQFEFVNDDGEQVENLKHATLMIAIIDCMNCKWPYVILRKDYNPVPLHYDSLLTLCAPVNCAKCGTEHTHFMDEDGEDAVRIGIHEDPNQLKLF